MQFDEIKAMEQQYVMQTYGRSDIALVRGEGATLIDSEGRRYIDMGSGIGVNSLGYGHPQLTQAICEQAQQLMHCSNLYYSEPMVQVARHLVEASGLSRVFFANSGAEANEAMIKTARKYSSDRYGAQRCQILTLKQSFHGRTMTTLMATGQEKFHQYFYPFPQGFSYVTPGDIDEFYEQADAHVCAVILEMIQGEGGVLPLDKAYAQAVCAYCKEHDILVCVDEVQTGIGRTGTLFCYEQYGITPDIVSLAKGLGGGVPIGAILCGAKCADTLQPGQHGSTFGGNLLACRAAQCVLSIVDQPSFLQSVKEKGDRIREQLTAADLSAIRDIRGLGLMLGIGVEKEKRAGYVQKLQEMGVIVLTAGTDTIRLLPPLVITNEEIDQALACMKEVLK
ncbi:aspartate aminotransferase family protein [Amedibacillus dolichus]|uniref:Acetylornithine aminotransferase n=1 Tax=Amedibacillus dolichus TaxID=31971 RepID=A0ABT7UBY0_9FIRM|nr:aspartate aminotransferase family protein [Amedibacillus dolichus]MDM8157136.1 aspartate aminotransferase family protein [Amedibacillus dolichus]